MPCSTVIVPLPLNRCQIDSFLLTMIRYSPSPTFVEVSSALPIIPRLCGSVGAFGANRPLLQDKLPSGDCAVVRCRHLFRCVHRLLRILP